MANINVARSTGDLFPIVASAVEQFLQANPGKEARNLARGLSNEEILFRQFVERLVLLSGSWPSNEDETTAENRGRSDRLRTESLNNDLQNTGEALLALRSELNITSRGSEVLSKLKPKPIALRKGQTQSSLQKCLEQLSKLNRRLAAHLQDSETISLPYVAEYQGSLDFRVTMERDPNNSVEASKDASSIKVTGSRCVCFCQKPLQEDQEQSSYSSSSASDIYTPPSTQESEAADGLENRHFQHGSVAVRSVDSVSAQPSLLMDTFSSKLWRDRDQYDSIGGSTIPLTMQASAELTTPVTLGDLLGRSSVDQDSRMRLNIAFHLSSAVILLASQRNRSRFSKWNHWTAAFERDLQKDRCAVYLIADHGSIGNDNRPQDGDSAFAIMARTATLTLLGLRLAELALGQTLAEVRSADAYLLSDVKADDVDMLDLLTVKRLLAQHRIRDKVGQLYESVVTICIYQQYRLRKSGSIKQLDPNDDSFLENAAVSILQPLYQEICESFDCECYRSQRKDRRPTGPNIGTTPDPTSRSHQAGDYKSENIGDSTHREQLHDLLDRQKARQDAIPAHAADPKSAATDSNVSEAAGPAAEHEIRNIKTQPTKGMGMGESNPPRQPNQAILSPAGSHQDPTFAQAHHSYPQTSPRQTRHDGSLEVPSRGPQSSLAYRVKSKADEKAKTTRLRPKDDTLVVDQDAVSESMESLTATTDSAFIWLSDDSEEPYLVSVHHPIFVLKDVTVRILMRNFDKWRSCGTDTNEVAGQPSQATHSTSKKRKKGSAAMTGSRTGRIDRGEEDDEDETQDPGQPSSDRHSRAKKPVFSCPFFKRDPLSHDGCREYTLHRIRDVKQHLGRRHQLPFYCPTCTQTFRDEELRDTHLRDANCERKPLRRPEGITNQQKKQLSRKAPANQTPREQWYGIFDILFPGHTPRPDSPYLDNHLTQQVLDFQSYFRAQGVQTMHEILSMHGMLTSRGPPEESEVVAYQKQVIADGIQIVFDQWRQSQSVQGMNPEQLGSTTSPHASLTTGPLTAVTTTTEDDTGEESQSVDAASSFANEQSSYEPSMSSLTDSSHWFSTLELNSPNIGDTTTFNLLTPEDRQEISDTFMTEMGMEPQFNPMSHPGGGSDVYGRRL